VLNHDSLGVWNRLCLTHDAVVVSLPHINVHRPPLFIIILLKDFCFMFASCACGFGRLIFIHLHFVNFLFFKVHEAYPYSIHEENNGVELRVKLKVWLHEVAHVVGDSIVEVNSVNVFSCDVIQQIDLAANCGNQEVVLTAIINCADYFKFRKF